MDRHPPSEPRPSRAIGPIRLAPGVRPAQVGLFVLVVICAASVVTFLPLMQAYVFTEMLGVPKAGQGRLAGNLVTVQQLAVLLFIGFAGSLADRIGRRNVLGIAFTGYACCMFAYPLAGSVALLFVLQFAFGTLSTGHITGAATMIADYPDNASRGKFVAANLLLQAALGALLVGWVGARLPGWLVAGGAAPDIAGRWAFWIVAAVALAAAVAVFGGLENPPRAAALAAPQGGGLRGFARNLGQVVSHGRRNPRFGLVMTMGFVIRADYFVMLSFVSLWVVNAAADRGISTVDALQTAGLLTITLKIATAVSQALFGFVADRVRRATLLVLSLAATGLTLCATSLVTDVFGPAMFLVVALIGIAESALIVCGQAMLGEEAPPALRGSAMGIFYFTGTLGVVITSAVSGLLFDRLGYSAPFVLIGLLNLGFAILGTWMLWSESRSLPQATPRSDA